MTDLVLSELNIYPIKSAGGIALPTAQVDKTGLKHDRRWMIVDASGRFMTQRQFPQMALIKVKLGADGLTLVAPGREPLSVVADWQVAPLQVEVWGDRCTAIPAGEAARQWLTAFLGVACQLVYMPDSTFRPVESEHATDPSRDQVSFADAYPFLLISEASLQDLNDRLETSLPMNRFRPNLVVRGCEPYEEDCWRQICIGTVVFHIVKPCSRCVITTTDQHTAVRGKEPLATLAQYRLHKGKIFFGQNLLSTGVGSIAVGDTIEVLQVAESNLLSV
jgi:hypothetical protein